MAQSDDPEYPLIPSHAASIRRQTEGDAGDEFQSLWRRRRGEDQEIASLIAALRAADFDLSDPKNRDDERKLTKMLTVLRERVEKREKWTKRRAGSLVWLLTAGGGAALSQIAPGIVAWLKAHLP